MPKSLERRGSQSFRAATISAGFGIALTVAVSGCASGDPGATTGEAESSTTNPPSATETIYETSTPEIPLCDSDDLTVEIVDEGIAPISLKFSNVSDSGCKIEAGYPAVTPLDGDGQEIAPQFEEANEYDQTLSDIYLEPGDSAWAIISYLAISPNVPEIPVSTLQITLPGSETIVTVPFNDLFHYSSEDFDSPGFIRPLTPEQETKSIS